VVADSQIPSSSYWRHHQASCHVSKFRSGTRKGFAYTPSSTDSSRASHSPNWFYAVLTNGLDDEDFMVILSVLGCALIGRLPIADACRPQEGQQDCELREKFARATKFKRLYLLAWDMRASQEILLRALDTFVTLILCFCRLFKTIRC
jgi:hypothetical protein